MSLAVFQQREENPNPHGVCACQPHGLAAPQEPPFTIFEASETDSPTDPHIVVCAGCLREAADQLGSPAVDNQRFIAGGPEPEANVEYASLPAEQQQSLADDFPNSLVGLGEGQYVFVPGKPGVVDGTATDEGDALASLAAEAPEAPPQLEPGEAEGELVPAEED